jgi:hypothetical protein
MTCVACSSGTGKASTGTTLATATVQQVASVVAQHKGSIDQLLATDQAPYVCDGLGYAAALALNPITVPRVPSYTVPGITGVVFPPPSISLPNAEDSGVSLVAAGVQVCTMQLDNIESRSKALVSDLSALAPPPELSTLVDQTIAAARQMIAVATATRQCINRQHVTGLAQVQRVQNCPLAIHRTLAAFDQVLMGWTPYGVP